MNQERSDFPPTDWTLIFEADAEINTGPRLSLSQLLTRYVPAMRSHLVDRRRMNEDRAEDLLQSFIADKMIERTLLAQADRSRGRFRDLLSRSLDNFVRDVRRREQTTRRSPGLGKRIIPLEDPMVVPTTESIDSFDRIWAESVMADAVRRTVLRCKQTNRERYWQLFEARTFGVEDRTAPYEQLIGRFGFSSCSQAADAVVTVKRILGRMVRQVLIEHAGGGPDIHADEELQDLRRIFSRCSAVQ